MTIKSGPPPSLAMSEIAAEFGGAHPLYLSQFYRDGARVPNTGQNGAISTSGGINIGMFYNTAAYVNVGPIQTSDASGVGTYDFYAPAHTTKVVLYIQAGGGGGSGGGGDGGSSGGDAGCCGYPGEYASYTVAIQPGDLVRCVTGAGGAGGLGVYAGSNSMNPLAVGLGGGNSYVYIYRAGSLIWSVGLAGGAQQWGNGCGGGGLTPCYANVCAYGYAYLSNSGIQAALGLGNTAGTYGYVAITGEGGYWDSGGGDGGTSTWITYPIYTAYAGAAGTYGGGGGGGTGAGNGANGPGSAGGNGFIRAIFRDS